MVAFLAVPVFAADSPAPAVSGATLGPVAQVQSVPAPTPPALSPKAAEVVKLARAGVGDEVILAYVKNCQSPFNLSANAILRLKEAGVASPVIVAMLTHDSSLRNENQPAPYASSQNFAPAEQPPGGPGLVPADQAPPPAPAEVITAAPGPDYYWTPGYWGWDGGWIWIGGGWGLRGGYGWGGYGWGGRYGGGWYGHGGWGGYHGIGGGYRGGGGWGGGYHGGGGGGGHGGGGGGHGGGGGGGHGGGGHGR